MNLASCGHKLACEIPWGVKGAGRQESAWRVLRGGSWNNNNRDNLTRALPSVSPCGLPAAVSPARSHAPVVLSSYRNNNDPENRNNNGGFRVVCEER